jgi:hypothetical protein
MYCTQVEAGRGSEELIDAGLARAGCGLASFPSWEGSA